MISGVHPCPCCNQKVRTKNGKQSVARYIRSQQAEIKQLQNLVTSQQAEIKQLQNLVTSLQKGTASTTITQNKKKTTSRQVKSNSGSQSSSPLMVTMSKSEYNQLKATDNLLNGSHTPGKTPYSTKRMKFKKFKEMQRTLGIIHIETDEDIQRINDAIDKEKSDKKNNMQCGRSGRVGTSHAHKATKTVRHYVVCCEICGDDHITQTRPKNKLELEFKDNVSLKDGTSCVECIAHVAEQAICQKCGHTTTAKWILIEGTMFGSHLLAFIMYMACKKNTDEDIAEHISTVFRCPVKTNSIWNARKVCAIIIIKTMQYIMDELKRSGYVAMDESRFGKAYAWLARTDIATLVKVINSRKADILYKLFAELQGMNAVVDGYAAYTKFFAEIQRCFAHLLRDAEKVAIQAGLGSKYDHLSDDLHQLYHEAKLVAITSDAISEATCQEFETRFLNIAKGYGDHPLGTKLKNAAPDVFTFLNYHDMDATNNPTEQDVRQVVVLQRNFRHKLINELGMQVYGNIHSFASSCKKMNLSIMDQFLHIIEDPNWNIFDEYKRQTCEN